MKEKQNQHNVWSRIRRKLKLGGILLRMREIVFVLLAFGGYLLVQRLIGTPDLVTLFYVFYLAWLPFAVFIWWRLSHLTRSRLPRSLLFSAVFSPSITGIYRIIWFMPLPYWLYFIISDSIAEPGSLSFRELGWLLPFIVPPFLLIWIVAYTGMSLSSSKRVAAWRDSLSQTELGALLFEIKRQRGFMIGLIGLLVIAGAITFGVRGQRDQAVAGPRYEVPPSGYDSYQSAQSFTSEGTGPIRIPSGTYLLLHFQPSELASEIEFVKSLTLHIATSDSSRTGIAPVDFKLWDFEGAWRFKQIVWWFQNSIKIGRPDNYVSRTGETYLELWNYSGRKPIELADVNFTLVVQHTDGTESVYAPTQ